MTVSHDETDAEQEKEIVVMISSNEEDDDMYEVSDTDEEIEILREILTIVEFLVEFRFRA